MSAFKKMFKQQDNTEDPNRPMSSEEKRQYEADHAAFMKADEDRETKKARDWLHKKGICDRNLEGPDRRKKLQAYVATLRQPKPGRDWANGIIEDYESGNYESEYGYRLACDTVGKEPVVIKRECPF